MAKIDALKEELGILKFWLGIAVATLLALAGWVATNYQKTEWFIILGAVVCMLISVIAIYILNKAIRKKIKDIGKE